MNVEGYSMSIGFNLPPPFGWQALVRLEHLRRFIRLQLIEPAMEHFRARPRPHGYFLGNFSALEKGRSDIKDTGRKLVTDRLTEIKTTSDEVGAKVILVMIPAPVQVCQANQLAYYPRNVDLNDTTRFDIEQPQRITREIADSLALKYLDLRAILKSATGGCPYQPHNMHWTTDGHRVVASYLAQELISDGIILTAQVP